jgi:hypothetical protein
MRFWVIVVSIFLCTYIATKKNAISVSKLTFFYYQFSLDYIWVFSFACVHIAFFFIFSCAKEKKEELEDTPRKPSLPHRTATELLFTPRTGIKALSTDAVVVKVEKVNPFRPPIWKRCLLRSSSKAAFFLKESNTEVEFGRMMRKAKGHLQAASTGPSAITTEEMLRAIHSH